MADLNYCNVINIYMQNFFHQLSQQEFTWVYASVALPVWSPHSVA